MIEGPIITSSFFIFQKRKGIHRPCNFERLKKELKLLNKGYIVHATLRNLDDVSKVSLLRSLPDSDERLVLFEADFYNPDTSEQPIEGCEFVFHVATPLDSYPKLEVQEHNRSCFLAGAKSIADACLKSGTVRMLIYTASVVAASPLEEDGCGFKDSMDETCWTPLDVSVACSNDFLKDYTDSKTLAEKEILSYNNKKRSGLEVVSLVCGLVGGDSLPSFTTVTVACLVSQLTSKAIEYNSLRYLEELIGKIPIVHIDDVCDAHIFCMESPSMNGRFLCARSYVSSAQIASYYQQYYPELEMKQTCLDLPKRQIGWGSIKLSVEGFVYKYDTTMILDECIKSARKWGSLL